MVVKKSFFRFPLSHFFHMMFGKASESQRTANAVGRFVIPEVIHFIKKKKNLKHLLCIHIQIQAHRLSAVNLEVTG